jgi:glycosyltransferase involved in cell wall biosynthesis
VRNSERIIFVPFIHAFGGVERLVLGLSRFLHEHGIPHTVLCFNQTIDFAGYADWPINVQELTHRRAPVSEGLALNRYLRAAHACGSPPPLLFDLKGAFYAGMIPTLDYHLHLTDPPSLLPSDVSKSAFSLRQTYPTTKNEAWTGLVKMMRSEVVHRINRRGARRARSVIVMTHAIADELRRIYAVEPKIVRPGVRVLSSTLLTPELAVDRVEKFRMLSVCRLEPNKRIDWILNTLGDLDSSTQPLSKKTDWCIDLVGDGSQRELLQKLAANRGIADRVVFHGKISDERVEKLFADARLFLMPAVQGYGLPALEALARGVPVVLHRESGVSEILRGTPWAEIIEDSSDELALAIKTMVDRLRSEDLKKIPMPTFQDETDWARQICLLCQWL